MPSTTNSLKRLRRQVAQEREIIRKKAEKKQLERELRDLRFQQTKIGSVSRGFMKFSKNIQQVNQKKKRGKSNLKKFGEFSRDFQSNINKALGNI